MALGSLYGLAGLQGLANAQVQRAQGQYFDVPRDQMLRVRPGGFITTATSGTTATIGVDLAKDPPKAAMAKTLREELQVEVDAWLPKLAA